MSYPDRKDISVLIGKTITEITGDVGSEEIRFDCSDGTSYRMIYYPDCCAGCDIEDITGDLADLIGSPIVGAREESNSDEPKPAPTDGSYHYQDESFTWTYYIIQSGKGAVTIRWYGSSNGYYSESATFEEVK